MAGRSSKSKPDSKAKRTESRAKGADQAKTKDRVKAASRSRTKPAGKRGLEPAPKDRKVPRPKVGSKLGTKPASKAAKPAKGETRRDVPPPRSDRASQLRAIAPPTVSVDLIVEDGPTSQVTLTPASRRAPASQRRSGPSSGRNLPPPRSSRSQPAVVTDPRAPYRDDGEIARGGMGCIRRVVDRRLIRRVAMKTFECNEADTQRATRRFIEEAQITGQLDHPNIVPVYEMGFDGPGKPAFFTMKLVKGRDFGQLITELGAERLQSRNLERLVQIVVKACEAVSFAHSHGVIHRDLKPANLMVGSHGQVYVMDWGLALLRARKGVPEDEHQHAIGTPAYMAPEQAWPRLDEIDERTDVFGLGGILYAIMTGGPPYLADTPINTVKLARKGEIADPREMAADLPIPPELRRIAMKALAYRPKHRYRSVLELQTELEQFVRGGGWLETRVYRRGEQIIEEGDEAHEAFIVVSGHCEAYKMVGKRKRSLQKMGPGEVFGETVFLTGQRRQASVVAKDKVTLKVITRESLELELARNSWIKSFITVLAERFIDVSSQLTKLTGAQDGAEDD
ncbi:MAG: protein kinase [Deltaproteobacteria bacterium]|nr:protein kinase [Deltaproteobacteria bacterium]